MADQKQEITFGKSMIADKRNKDFAYLIKNVFESDTPGLYPGKDFERKLPNQVSGITRIVDVLGSSQSPYQIKVISETDSGNTNFHNLGSNSISNTALTGITVDATAFGSDGVYIFGDDSKVYRVNHTNSNTPDLATDSNNILPVLGAFDGLYYWWVGAKIGKQLPGSSTITEAFTATGLTGNSSPRFVDFFDDEMVIFAQSGNSVAVFFWNKSDTTFYSKRILIKNSRLIAGGVVDGQLMLVRSVGNSTNMKEQEGEIIISAFNGQNFVRINSIKAGRGNVQWASDNQVQNTSARAGSEILVFSVDNNDRESKNPDLYQNYVYKLRKDGSLEAMALPIADGRNYAHIVNVFQEFNLFVVDGDSPTIYTNQSASRDFDDYDGYTSTEYITNFYGDPGTLHRLDSFNISFERLFRNTENTGQPPVPGGSGVIGFNSLTHEAVTLTWVAADDAITPDDQLQYRVYISNTNNIGSVQDMLDNGMLLQDWATDITSYDVSGLTKETSYYFNVMVRDLVDNRAAYVQKLITTTEEIFLTSWMSPASYGTIYFSGVDQTDWTNPANALTENGSYATQTGSPGCRTAYYGFGFSIPTGATIRGIETRMKGFTNTADPARKFSTALTKQSGLGTGGKTDLATYGSQIDSAQAPTANEFRAMGSTTELWGTTWTPAEINASSFGSFASNTSAGVGINYSLDVIQVRVAYAI